MAKNFAAVVAGLNTKKTQVVFDKGTGAVPGLFVRVSEAGTIRFGLRYTVSHQKAPTSKALGSIADWTRDGAFDVEGLRGEARGLLERQKFDHVSPAMGTDNTMAAVFNHYVEGLRTGEARRKNKGVPASEKSIACAQSAWKVHMEKRIGHLAPAKLTTHTIGALHRAVGAATMVEKKTKGRGSRKRGGKYAANRTIAMLKAAWNLSSAEGLTQNLHNPFAGLSRYAETVRTVYLKKSDTPKFMEAVFAEPEPFRTYWHMMLLTGARGAELRALRWADVDLDGRLITFRNTKGKILKHEVPLSKTAHGLLKNLERSNERVFPFRDGKDSWQRIRVATGLMELRPHDVRRTVGSWLGAAGKSAEQIGAVFGHAKGSTVTARVYMNLGADENVKVEAIDLQDELLKKHSNVVPFGRKKAA